MDWLYTADNPLKVFTAFSGYDSQMMALRNIGIPYECVGWSEIDKYAIMAHDAVFPEDKGKNFGDISKINWEEVPDFDLMTYSSPCFVAGTKVLTEKGYTNIEELRGNDKVLTIDGSWRSVEKLGSDGEKPIFRVKAEGMLAIECTDNHPFLVRNRERVWHNDVRRWKFEFSEPKKTRVNELTAGKSFIGIPIINEEVHLDMSDEELWVLGRYVADGHLSRKDKAVMLSIGSRKLSDFEAKVTIPHSVFSHTKSCHRIVFRRDSRIYALVESGMLGFGSANKFISPLILRAERNQLRAFLDGYMSGDGCFIKESGCYQATTISKDLAQSLVLAVQKVYGVGCKIYFTKRPSTHIIEGREVNQSDTYMVRWRNDSPKHQWYNDGDFIWYPVKEVADTGANKTIWNITVEGNHTYTANNALVFNCQDFSNAGLQRGGEEGSGTRSSLLWEVKKAVLAKHPKFLLMENVKALVSKKFMPTFQLWLDWLSSQGYTNFWQVLNAKDYGIPQNRERVFVVSTLEPMWYTFPQPVPLELRLKDLLEEKVDEKYYINQERVDSFIAQLPPEKLKDLEDGKS